MNFQHFNSMEEAYSELKTFGGKVYIIKQESPPYLNRIPRCKYIEGKYIDPAWIQEYHPGIDSNTLKLRNADHLILAERYDQWLDANFSNKTISKQKSQMTHKK